MVLHVSDLLGGRTGYDVQTSVYTVHVRFAGQATLATDVKSNVCTICVRFAGQATLTTIYRPVYVLYRQKSALNVLVWRSLTLAQLGKRMEI